MFGGGEDDAPLDPELQTALALETAKASGADGADGASVTAKLITMLPRLFFETRKDAAAVFNAIVRHPVDARGDLPHVRHLDENPRLLLTILTASELGEDGAGNAAVRPRPPPQGSPSTSARHSRLGHGAPTWAGGVAMPPNKEQMARMAQRAR